MYHKRYKDLEREQKWTYNYNHPGFVMRMWDEYKSLIVDQ
jgi:hypothetical protein